MLTPVTLEFRRGARLQTPNRMLNRKTGKPTEGKKGQRATTLPDLQEGRSRPREQEEKAQPKRAKESTKSRNEVWQPASTWGRGKTEQARLAGDAEGASPVLGTTEGIALGRRL